MRKHQSGVTFIGWLVLLIPMAIVIYAGIRVLPVYLNYMKVAKTVEQVAVDSKGEGVNPAVVRIALERRFDIESISYPSVEQIEVVRENQVWIIKAVYEQDAPLFAGIKLQVNFDKRVVIQ
jgi:hypothetical protein